MTARRKTRFVVSRGKIGRPLSLRENLNGRGAKMDRVPVPVLIFVSCFLDACWVDNLPIWSSLALIKYLANKIEVLDFLVWCSHFYFIEANATLDRRSLLCQGFGSRSRIN